MLPSDNIDPWQRLGGLSALFEALAYVFGFTVMFLFLAPSQSEELTAVGRLEFLLGHQHFYQLWMVIIYVLFGLSLVPLVTALYRRLKLKDQPAGYFGTVFGYVWVVLVIASGMIGMMGLEAAGRMYEQDSRQAAVVWATLEGVQNGLGGGVEIVGGLWVFLISLAALRGGALPSGLNVLGLLTGLAGILTILPGADALGAVFGLLQIPWFLGAGYTLLRIHH